MGGVARVIRPPKPPAPPAAPIVVAPTKPEVSQAYSATTTDMARGKGRSSTILTGAKGLGDNKLTTSKRTLLGG
tara:strand:- start:763 stop:984 length:222 start_codon:yes stop_codon:yes gene_type:complete